MCSFLKFAVVLPGLAKLFLGELRAVGRGASMAGDGECVEILRISRGNTTVSNAMPELRLLDLLEMHSSTN